MRFAAILLISFVLILLGAEPGRSAGLELIKIDVDGVKRSFLLYSPEGAEPSKAAPLVVMLHGAGKEVRSVGRHMGWLRKADEAHFYVIFPEGLPLDPASEVERGVNPRVWNDGRPWPDTTVPPDDTAFLGHVLDRAALRVTLDRRRIYLVGYSNGGGMVMKAAAVIGQRIAALGSVAGTLWERPAKLPRDLPLIQLVGTEDPQTPLPGGIVASLWGRTEIRPPAIAATEIWSEMLGCKDRAVERVGEPPVETTVYKGCRNMAEVRYVTVPGQGHLWPGARRARLEEPIGPETSRVFATDLIWDFLSRFQLPEKRPGS